MKSLRSRILTASLSFTASILLATPAMADSLTGATIAGTLTRFSSPFLSLPESCPGIKLFACP